MAVRRRQEFLVLFRRNVGKFGLQRKINAFVRLQINTFPVQRRAFRRNTFITQAQSVLGRNWKVRRFSNSANLLCCSCRVTSQTILSNCLETKTNFQLNLRCKCTEIYTPLTTIVNVLSCHNKLIVFFTFTYLSFMCVCIPT